MILTPKSGKEVIVDDDFTMPSKTCLTVTSHGYASLVKYTGKRTAGGWYKYSRVYLHRFISNAPSDLQVDHINGNRLDNRRENLRLCKNQQNNFNKKARSGYKGVHKIRDGKWCAQITLNYKCKNIGYFSTAEEAALAYNSAARDLHGEFAYQNRID